MSTTVSDNLEMSSQADQKASIMIRKRVLFLLPMVVLFCLFRLPVAHAQVPPQIIIIYPAPELQADSLALSVFFVLVDENGQPIARPNIESAEIQLFGHNSSPVPAMIEDPQSPFYIALLLDASGSMSNAMPGVREAAQAALENAPPTARVGVFKFNELAIDEPLRPIEDFTGDLVLVQGGINAVQAEPKAPTCLYNALYQTIELLDEATQAPQERGAILLFTDGKDERADGTPCSQRNYQDVVNRATRAAPITPIHTLGLCTDAQCSNIKKEELLNMAQETFAFSATGSQDQMGDLFKQVMEGLNSQWVARADVYPRQGDNDAVLRVTLRDGGSLTENFKFFSDGDRAEPVQPVTIQIDGPKYDRTRDIFELLLTINNAETVQEVIVQVWDSKRGLLRDHVYDPASARRIEIKPEGFIAGNEYFFRVLAIDKQGKRIPGEEGKQYLAETEPVIYDPVRSGAVVFSIKSVTPDYEAGKLIINLSDIPDEGRIAKYEGFIVEAENANQIAEIEPEVYETGRIEIDLPEAIKQIQETTGYRVTLNLTTKDDISSEAVSEFKAEPQEPPGFLLMTWLALSNSPILTISIVIITLCVAIVLVYRSRPSKGEGLPPPQPRPPIDQTMIDPSPKLQLKVLKLPDSLQEKEKAITTFPFVIGRDSCDFNIPDQHISRRHIEITVRNGKFFVTDLESRNGTFIGSQQLLPHQPTPLDTSTILRLGQHTQLQLES